MKRREALIRITGLGIVSFMFLYLFSLYSSPITSMTGVDYDVFVTGGAFAGKGELYTGFFDSKGPYQFLINYLGLVISSGKWGIFILEVAYLTLVLNLLWSIGQSLGASRKRNVCGTAFALLMLAFTYNYGSPVEIWSLPFIVLPLYITVRNDNRSKALIYGICIGVLSMIRLNNAAPVLGIAIVDFFFLHRGPKQIKSRLIYIIQIICGIIIGALPAILYCIICGSVVEMWNATIVYGFKYWDYHHQFGYKALAINLSLMSVCIILPIISAIRRPLNRRITCLIAAMCLFTAIPLLRIWFLAHYYILLTPFYFLVFSLFPAWKHKMLASAIVVLLIVTPWGLKYHLFITDMVKRPYLMLTDKEYADSVNNHRIQIGEILFANIPEADRDNIYQLEIPSDYWGLTYYSGHLPVGKYTFQQEMINNIWADDVRNDVLSSFDTANPKWIISGVKICNSPLNERDNIYELRDSVVTVEDNKRTVFYIYSRIK